jgi:hypothetical protein
VALALPLSASDHGPVFGLGTPTNPKGGWSFNLGFNRRGGSGMMQTQLSYGVTQNLKLTFSAPLDVQADAHAPSSVTASVPFAGDFGLTAWYRFYRKDLKGKRVEATATGGPLFSGPQQEVDGIAALPPAWADRRRSYRRRIAQLLTCGRRDLPVVSQRERKPSGRTR